MRITIESIIDGRVVHKSMVEGDGVNIVETLQEIKECLLGVGFQPESIKEAICEKAEEYTR